jgi:hypothetical protein
VRFRRADVPSVVAGLALVALGAVLLADALGSLDLSLAGASPLVCAAVGSVLLATGLTRGR